LYIVVMDQYDKLMVELSRNPNIAPVFRPSTMPLAPAQCSIKVSNRAAIKFETIIAHHAI